MKFGRIVRRAKQEFREARLTTGLPTALDRRLFHRTGVPSGPRDSHVLLAAPGGGNIGDQAMLEAFLENVEGPVVVIVREPDASEIPPSESSRVEMVVMPHLLYSDGPDHRRAIRDFASLLGRARSFSVVGADIMDGKYSLRASVRRSSLARFAAEAGVDSRILGFSWNGTPRRAARDSLRQASRQGAVPLLRDPISASRARSHGVARVRESADVVFAATSIDDSILAELDPGDARPLAVVNVSGLIGRKMNQLAEYESIVDDLLSRGMRVVLLPHVRSAMADDFPACSALRDRVGADRVMLIERRLAPAEVRGLAAAASLVITGRMHLAIMALWNGTPAITLATQGKVEGLMRYFQTEELCVEPTAGFGRRIVSIIDQVLGDEGTVTHRIREHLPTVRSLAKANFDGMIG